MRINTTWRHRLAPLLLSSLLLLSCGGATPAASTPPAPCPAPPPSEVLAPPPATPAAAETPQAALPSWEDGPTKSAIVAFVQKVTDPDSADFVPGPERIAVFDNDGTLWSEQPMYVQLAFTLDRIKELAPEHPEWKYKQPYKAAIEGDMKALGAAGMEGFLKLVMATHAGMTSEEFTKIVQDWFATARHPKYGRLYTELTYQPMVELLGYLRVHDFKTFVVSGGGLEFMRPWMEGAYGIPPEQVIGTRVKTQWDEKGPSLLRMPEIAFIDDGPGKPVGIYEHIGRRPIFAAGNSDGDLQMLQYTTAGKGPRFALIVHHTDAERETAYDRESHIGKLDKALDAASANGWTVVDMKKDWKQVFRAASGTSAATNP